MRLMEPEPPAGPWRVVALDDFAATVLALAGTVPGRPPIVAVDGRSGGGKTTVASRLREAIPGAAEVHTDDVAWHHSFFGWDDLLLGGILDPVRRGQEVSYRPPAWSEWSRDGAITVAAGASLLIVEGVGSGRRELAPALDGLIWVQSDLDEAQRRGIIRDGGDAHAVSFWHEWMGEELPFLAADRPWERAGLIVSGTPDLPHDPSSEVVVAPPLGPAG
ncbi:MAG TPA: hypothetical protein VIA06_13085 [Candidatus Dormibacteraeota bacterium]|jgi:hypothetical protein|nr:hypothetical protein [Candidatus Dormibacteraeota bacterium]